MGDLRAAREVAARLANVGGIPVEFRTEANAQLITLDRLAIVEWLREYIDRDGCDTDDLLAIPDRLESAIKRAGGGEL